VIGAGGFAVPDAFRKRLALALSRFGQIATVDSATLAVALSGGIEPSRLERFAFGIHPASARRLVAFVSAHDDAHA
jgi:hypothetical protein